MTAVEDNAGRSDRRMVIEIIALAQENPGTAASKEDLFSFTGLFLASSRLSGQSKAMSSGHLLRCESLLSRSSSVRVAVTDTKAIPAAGFGLGVKTERVYRLAEGLKADGFRHHLAPTLPLGACFRLPSSDRQKRPDCPGRLAATATGDRPAAPVVGLLQRLKSRL